VTGAGGFIGHHLVARLKSEGHWVRGADIKLPEYEASAADEFAQADLRKYDNCLLATRGGVDQVYNLAADMGGIGYITASHADIARNSVLINTHMLEASRLNGVSRFLFPRPLASMLDPNKPVPRSPLCGKKTHIQPTLNRATDGRSSLPKNFAATIAMTTNSKPALCASTMFMARWERTRAAKRRRPQRSPER
jgi:nucleoside-diphosphate-sugar epimerase